MTSSGLPVSASGFVAGAATENVESARSTAMRVVRCMLMNCKGVTAESGTFTRLGSEVVEKECEECGGGTVTL